MHYDAIECSLLEYKEHQLSLDCIGKDEPGMLLMNPGTSEIQWLSTDDFNEKYTEIE